MSEGNEFKFVKIDTTLFDCQDVFFVKESPKQTIEKLSIRSLPSFKVDDAILNKFDSVQTQNESLNKFELGDTQEKIHFIDNNEKNPSILQKFDNFKKNFSKKVERIIDLPVREDKQSINEKQLRDDNIIQDKEKVQVTSLRDSKVTKPGLLYDRGGFQLIDNESKTKAITNLNMFTNNSKELKISQMIKSTNAIDDLSSDLFKPSDTQNLLKSFKLNRTVTKDPINQGTNLTSKYVFSFDGTRENKNSGEKLQSLKAISTNKKNTVVFPANNGARKDNFGNLDIMINGMKTGDKITSMINNKDHIPKNDSRSKVKNKINSPNKEENEEFINLFKNLELKDSKLAILLDKVDKVSKSSLLDEKAILSFLNKESNQAGTKNKDAKSKKNANTFSLSDQVENTLLHLKEISGKVNEIKIPDFLKMRQNNKNFHNEFKELESRLEVLTKKKD